jgi:hypothetical protein
MYTFWVVSHASCEGCCLMFFMRVNNGIKGGWNWGRHVSVLMNRCSSSTSHHHYRTFFLDHEYRELHCIASRLTLVSSLLTKKVLW